MSFRNQQSHALLREINRRFEDVTCDFDKSDTAVAEYDGLILQVIFPDPENGFPSYSLLMTDITKFDTTVYFRNTSGSEELNISEVVSLVDDYIKRAKAAFLKRQTRNSNSVFSFKTRPLSA